MKEITLNLKTTKVPGDKSYNIDDMERMFGKRIKKAISTKTNKNEDASKALISKKMAKICRRWKFWNADIRKAYKNYAGMLIVPWTIVIEPPVISSTETGELMKKEIKEINIAKFSEYN